MKHPPHRFAWLCAGCYALSEERPDVCSRCGLDDAFDRRLYKRIMARRRWWNPRTWCRLFGRRVWYVEKKQSAGIKDERDLGDDMTGRNKRWVLRSPKRDPYA